MTERSVVICDVAPRDGLQNDPKILEPQVRAELVERLADAGLPRIEAVSFVNPARVPQMAGAEEVVAAIDRRPGVVYAGLVLNERGYDRLVETGLDEAHVAFAASETFNQRNQNATVEESVQAAERIVARAHEDGLRATVTIGTAFGCPFEGAVDPGRVRARAAARGCRGRRSRVRRHRRRRRAATGARDRGRGGFELACPIGLHLHNTRNTGFANAYAAVDAGATVLDASVGGIGGCPFAPRATGNVATEDLVYLLHGEGVETGVDLDRLVAVAEWLEECSSESSKVRSIAPGPSPRSPAEQEERMAHRLGVDVGGTFTDLLLVHDESGAMHRVKTPSTPGDPSEGVLVGVRRISDEAGTAVADIRNILHGTTVATNAVLESKGARVGLLTTVGFKQILHLARSQTPDRSRAGSS